MSALRVLQKKSSTPSLQSTIACGNTSHRKSGSLKIPLMNRTAARMLRRRERNLDSDDSLPTSSICYLSEDSGGVEVQFWQNSMLLMNHFSMTYLSGYQLSGDILCLDYSLFLR